jgi:SEC-C motif-containing protein
MAKHGPNEPCPCCSGKKYKRCCGPLHGGAPAPTPEALMRSRYAAYALGLVDYVLVTTAPDGPQANPDRRDVEDFAARTTFAGLEVLGAGSEGDGGWVQFRAILTQGGRDASFVEKSAFVRREGRWLYHSAIEHSGPSRRSGRS